MKIYRAPHIGGYWRETDSKEPNKYIDDWSPGNIIELDGTINKQGERHTLIGLELGENDIISLLNRLISYYKSEIINIEKQLLEQQENNKILMDAFCKIDALISFHRDRAPTITELTKAIKDIAEYYSLDNENDPPTPKWMKWENL